MANNRLLYLGGTYVSCEIIKKAQDMGYTVGVADYNPYESSPGKQIADEHYLVSCLDVGAVVQLIREKNFGGVLTGFSDALLPTYAEICEKSGLPCYGTKEQMELFTDKKKYKKFCKEHGVSCIEDFTIEDEDYDTASVRFPVLLKPAKGSGGQGLVICRNNEELKSVISHLTSKGDNENYIVERFMPECKEIVTEWIFRSGEYRLAYAASISTGEINGPGSMPMMLAYAFPSDLTKVFIEECGEKMKDMFHAAGIKNGIATVQCKVEGRNFYVFDIGYRLSGTFPCEPLQAMKGYDPHAMMIRYAMTGSMCTEEEFHAVDPLFDAYGYKVIVYTKAGNIAEIRGLEELIKTDEVTDAVIFSPEGESMEEHIIGTLAQSPVHIHGIAGDKSSLKNALESISRTLSIVSDTGEEMILPMHDHYELAERVL